MASLFKSTTTYDPIYALLNASTVKERNQLTERWRDHKLAELNFVGIVGALLAGVLTSTGSWPSILPNATPQPWTVRACWFSGIILALGSVLVAAQQSIRLHRLSCHPKANIHIRRLLSERHLSKRSGAVLPRTTQVYMWQLSVILLSVSVVAMLAGIFILIWSSTGSTDPGEPWWNGEAKLAVSFTVVATLVVILFVFQQITLYTWDGADDSDERCERERDGDSDSLL